ncbi:hypothetical protein HDU84_009286 [Entophlyctis sp. JEL0112]|nr:hypothetical protein HDU84_009286 [Entophlyctis sp. JEL0112]
MHDRLPDYASLKAFCASETFNSQRILIDRLRALGLDQYVELPQIAVMGDTSSGKSSVLSAISGIEFPSHAELTTRCPTQLVLSTAEAFTCTVCIIRVKNSKASSPPSLKLKEPGEIRGAITELTKIIIDDGPAISEDMISIEVSGPKYPNLTLIDLPGIVRTVADNEDPSMILNIRDLVTSYLQKKRTVILAVIPANVDMHNVEILQLAESVDPSGDRTIAIITKPDAVDFGAEKQIVDLLLNRKKFLKLGYHAMRCRGQQDLNEKMSIQEGVIKESKFFSNHPVWRNISPELLGVESLVPKLVNTLQNVINQSLTGVVEEINEKIEKCTEQLQELGEATDTDSKRRMFYCNFVNQLKQLMKDAITGSYESAFFRTDCENQEGKNFSSEEMVSGKQSSTHIRAILCNNIEEFKNGIMKSQNWFDERPRSSLTVGDFVEVKRGDCWFVSKVHSITHRATFFIEGSSDSYRFDNENWRFLQEMDFTKLKVRIAKNRGKELRVFPNYSLFCSLVREVVSNWILPTSQLLQCYIDSVLSLSQDILEHLLKEKFFKLHHYVLSVIKSTVEECKIKAKDAADLATLMEYSPSTVNDDLHIHLDKLRNRRLEDVLRKAASSGSIQIDRAIAMMNALCASGTGPEKEAMDMHHALTAYMKVASARYTDVIPMLFEQHFLEKFEEETIKNLMLAPDEDLRKILEEPSYSTQRREELHLQLTSLLDSRRAINRHI